MPKQMKIFLIVLGVIAATLVLYYFIDSISAFFLPLVFGSKYALDDMNKKEAKVKADLKEIEDKQKKLKSEGVKELTPDKEVDYWKDEWKDD